MNGARCTGAGWSKEGTGNLPSARVRKAPMQINAQFEVAVPSSFSLSRPHNLSPSTIGRTVQQELGRAIPGGPRYSVGEAERER